MSQCAGGDPVAVAFHAGNLAAVARAIRDNHPQADILRCADVDRETPGNPGLTLARPGVGSADIEGWVGQCASDWPDPEPPTGPLDPLPYPVDALPPPLREAQAFVQAPMAPAALGAGGAFRIG